MLRDLKDIVDRASGPEAESLEDDLREAARVLEQRQFIYGYDRGGRRRYDLVRRHRSYFVGLFDAFGKDLRFFEAEQMVGVFGRPGSVMRRMSKTETLFLVALRIAHEEKREAKEIDDFGCCRTTLDHVWTLVESHAGFKRPGLTASREIMVRFRGRGLLTDVEEQADDVVIEIRPAIRHVVTNATIAALERHATAKDAMAAEQEEGDLP